MTIRPPVFDSVAQRLAPHLSDLPGKLIAIDGRDGVGKTTLGRFLAWYFNVSLIETDLFLQDRGGQVYYTDQIERFIARRLSIPRPVIIEGITVLNILRTIDHKQDLLIYIENISTPRSASFAELFAEYEATFSPKVAADISINLSY